MNEQELRQIEARWREPVRWATRSHYFEEGGQKWLHVTAEPERVRMQPLLSQRPVERADEIRPLFAQLKHAADDVSTLLAEVRRLNRFLENMPYRR